MHDALACTVYVINPRGKYGVSQQYYANENNAEQFPKMSRELLGAYILTHKRRPTIRDLLGA